MWLCRWGGEGKVRYESCNDKRRESKRLKMYQMNEREEKGDLAKKHMCLRKVCVMSPYLIYIYMNESLI